MDGTGKLFAAFVEALPSGFKTEVVRYPADRCLSFSDLIHLIESTARCSEPFVLVAESFSSPLAIKWTNASTGMVAAVTSAISSVRPKVLSCRLRMVLRCDARSELSKVTVPMPFVQPIHDRLVGLDRLEEMRRIKPAAAVELIAGPHLLLQREPEKAAEVIVMFARRCREDND
jgi:pimeloyl-[acyl-carrier protein] methyl ester esterase